jgi:thiol-disulfide isomerase/thioredoxin
MKLLRTLLICSLLFCASASFAGGIDFLHNKNWKEILAQAKKENKLIFLDAYTSWCGPCKHMQSEVFTDMAVGYYFNKNFINVKMDMEEGEGLQLSNDLQVTSYPTFFFINGDGEVLHKKVGAMEAGDLLQLGDDARNPARQYYTIREKAMKGDVSAEDFHQWIHEANDLGEDVDSIIISYLAKTKNPRMEKGILSIMLDHAPLNKEQVEFLFKNKETALKLLNKTPEEFNSALQARVIVYATNESLHGEVFDFAKFQQIAQGYYPNEAALMTRKVKIRYYDYQEQYAKSLNELSDCITLKALKLKADDLAELVTQNIKNITDQNRIDEFIQKISHYNLLPEETAKAYQKDLSLFILYYCKDDRAKMKAYSGKILGNANAPEEIKSKVKEFMDETGDK